MREKTNDLGSEQVRHKPACTVTEADLMFEISEFKKKRDCTIRVVKTKALISFAVTAKLICSFVFAQAFCWFFMQWLKCVKMCRLTSVKRMLFSGRYKTQINHKAFHSLHINCTISDHLAYFHSDLLHIV